MKYVLLLLVFYASASYGMVYTWADSQGIRHYVNREHDIPVRYRTKVKALYPEPGDTGALKQNIPPPQIQPEVPTPAPATQAQTEEPVKVTQPVITPGPKNITPEQATRRGRARRNREGSEE